MIWLLDTNVCVDLLRGRARGRRLPAFANCRLAAIVAAELWTGANKANEPEAQRRKVGVFIELFEIAPFDAKAAIHYGEIRARLEKAGTPIGSLDQLIAAQALSLGATLLTGNLREFRRVPGLKCHAWE
jgi:tRNA(fMet)-specific endonuclease VapC